MAQLEQVAAASVAKYQSRTVRATFSRPTKPGSLLVAVVAAAGTIPSRLTTPSGFTLIGGERGLRDIQQSVWIRANAPATTSVSVTTLDAEKSMQLRVLEYSGIAQNAPLDKLEVRSGDNRDPYTGVTDTTTQNDELVLAFITNQYDTTQQYGFGGGFTRLYDTTSPSSYGNRDWERSRLTVHQRVAEQKDEFALDATLSSPRRWIALVATFKGGSIGPAFLTSTLSTEAMDTAGLGSLTVFGPLASGVNPVPGNTAANIGVGARARIGPFNHQYRLGGWNGLLIGVDTDYRVELVEGLEGWDVRTADGELPRGDGTIRGIDLQTARQILFRVNTNGASAGDPEAVEDALDTLYRTLVPQRDGDWELIWRHPGRPLRMIRVRPTSLIRELSAQQILLANQEFALLASDPRHYSAFEYAVTVPNTAAGGVEVPMVVINGGNGYAHPEIRIDGPAAGDEPVTRIEVENQTLDTTFTVEAVLPPRSTLVGDMEARALGAPRSAVTIDGTSKYGAWQHPRATFRLAPGANDIVLRTVPEGADVSAVLTYRDTYSG